jgi:5-methylcytosine-specific restriction protein A
MPMRLEKFCKEPSCNARTASRSGYCAEHELHNSKKEAQKVYDSNREPWQKWYDLAIWRKRLRPMALSRTPICSDCNREPATEADHIIPHRGNWRLFVTLENITGLCHNCHSKKTAIESGFAVCVPAEQP